MKPILAFLALLLTTRAHAQTTQYPDSPLLDSLLRTNPALTKVLSHPATYQLQLIYTQINRDAQNVPHFTQHTYHLNPRQYFNPASLVKLPVAILALEKLHTLPAPIIRSTIMSTGAAWRCQTPVPFAAPASLVKLPVALLALEKLHTLPAPIIRSTIMSTGAAWRCQTPVPFAAPADSDRTATVGNYIKRMLLVSDNLAYNRLYEFLGQKPLNDRLQQLGYPGSRIVRRFAPCDTAANRHTNPIAFHTPAGDTIYKQPAQTNPRTPAPPLGPVFAGRAYKAGDRLIHRPYEFTTANNLPLPDITDLLQTALFPESIPAAQRSHLTPADHAFLRQYLHLTPHASRFTPYAAPKYFDAYKKYLYYGRRPEAQPQPGLRIFNIVGMSHGYLTDVAYFADSLHQSEFLLSAVLYVNQDGIINDAAYEYDTIGEPFLAQLGQLFYQYEARRPRQYRPDLTLFFEKYP